MRRASKAVVERTHTHSRGALLSRLSKIGAQIEGSRTRRTLVRLSDTGALRRGSRYPAHYNKAHDGRRTNFLAHEGRRSAVEAHTLSGKGLTSTVLSIPDHPQPTSGRISKRKKKGGRAERERESRVGDRAGILSQLVDKAEGRLIKHSVSYNISRVLSKHIHSHPSNKPFFKS